MPQVYREWIVARFLRAMLYGDGEPVEDPTWQEMDEVLRRYPILFRADPWNAVRLESLPPLLGWFAPVVEEARQRQAEKLGQQIAPLDAAANQLVQHLRVNPYNTAAQRRLTDLHARARPLRERQKRLLPRMLPSEGYRYY